MVEVVVSFRIPLEDQNPENGSIDVAVVVENYAYVLTVATAKNLEFFMDKDKMNYVELGDPFIIVKNLTKEIILETLKAYAEYNNGYWLKFYHFVRDINETVFDDLQAEHINI